jgi:hypothetical protein
MTCARIKPRWSMTFEDCGPSDPGTIQCLAWRRCTVVDAEDRVMAGEADIQPGHYWVRNRKNGELSIVLVAKRKLLDGPEWTVAIHHDCEVVDDIETATQEYEFLARIEPPEFPS